MRRRTPEVAAGGQRLWRAPASGVMGALAGTLACPLGAALESRAGVKPLCVGAVKGFSLSADQPSARCDWHKYAGTKEPVWPSRSRSLHSAFAPPAVLPAPPTAAAIHQASLNSHSTQSDPRRSLYPKGLRAKPSGLGVPVRRYLPLSGCTVGGSAADRSTSARRCTQPVRTGVTPAPHDPGESFKAFIPPPHPALTLPLDSCPADVSSLFRRYCPASAATPFHHGALPSCDKRPAHNSSTGLSLLKAFVIHFPIFSFFKPSAAPPTPEHLQ